MEKREYIIPKGRLAMRYWSLVILFADILAYGLQGNERFQAARISFNTA